MALHLGQSDVEQLLKSLTSKQLLDWMRYDELEPFGGWRNDVGFASVRKTLWDIARDTKKHPEPFEINDFVLQFGGASEPPKNNPSGAVGTRVSAPSAVNKLFHILALAQASGAKDK